MDNVKIPEKKAEPNEKIVEDSGGSRDESDDEQYVRTAPYSESNPELNRLLDRLEPIENPNPGDRIVIFNTRNHPHYNYIYPLFAKSYLENDIPCYFFCRHDQISRTFPDLTIKGVQVTNAVTLQQFPFLYRSGQIGYPYYDWNVDFDNREITVKGLDDVNFYYVFLATLRNQRRKYNIDFSDPENVMAVQRGLLTADEHVRFCELLVQEARKYNLKITVAGWENEYLPNGIFWMVANSKLAGDHFEYMNLGTLYGHYYGIGFGENIGATNMTRRDVFFPFAGFKEEFEEYRTSIVEDDERRQEVERQVETDLKQNILLNPSREKAMELEEQEELKETIDDYQDRGQNVFTLFGHKFYDVGLYDSAPVFDDMCDWIDRTIEIFKDRDDLLILKPHPAEDCENVDHKRAPEELLSEYVADKISGEENILLLEPRAIGSIALYGEIDCGLIWRSSVGLEMSVFGLNVIIGGVPRYKEYVDLPYPETMDEYRGLIDDVKSINIGPDVQTSASIYLHFEKNYRHVYLPYVKGLDYNDFDSDELHWDEDALDEFINKGYEELDELLVNELKI